MAYSMSDQPDKCQIKVVPHPIKGVELTLKGDCSEALKVIEALPPRRRRYFERRIVRE